MRFVAWIILLVAAFWALAVETVEPSELGVTIDGGSPSEIYSVGSHVVPALLYDFTTLPGALHYLRFDDDQRLTLDTPDDGSLRVEVSIALRARRRRASDLDRYPLDLALNARLRPILEVSLLEVLYQASAADLRDPDIRRELATRAEIAGSERLTELGFELRDIQITSVTADTATESALETAGIAAVRAALAVSPPAP